MQVFQRGNLAGGVACQRQRQVGLVHATTVVADADQFAAAVLQFDLDVAGTGIETVFQNLFQCRSRTFHHFAGGDLVDQVIG